MASNRQSIGGLPSVFRNGSGKGLRSAVDASGIDVDKLTERITIEAPVTSQSSLGEPVKSWQVIAEEVWAGVEQTGGSESVQASQLHAFGQYLVLLRYRPGITEKMRIRLSSGERLAIASAEDWERRKVALFLTCTEDK